jgi:hypothetical protein
MLLPLAGGSGTVVTFGEFIMILELHRQGLKVAAIARQLGIDRKTVRKYISRGLEPPTYGPRPHRQKSTDPFLPYLRERLGRDLRAARLTTLGAVTFVVALHREYVACGNRSEQNECHLARYGPADPYYRIRTCHICRRRCCTILSQHSCHHEVHLRTTEVRLARTFRRNAGRPDDEHLGEIFEIRR